jgi:hypothetical protein
MGACLSPAFDAECILAKQYCEEVIAQRTNKQTRRFVAVSPEFSLKLFPLNTRRLSFLPLESI